MFNCLSEQFTCFIRIFGIYGLFKITLTKKKLNQDLLYNPSAFTRNPVPSLIQLCNRFSIFSFFK